MKRGIVVTGGTGFVGRKLVADLVARGEAVTVLGRTANDARVPAGARSVAWTPDREGPWADVVSGARAVVHLAGEPVLGRWTDARKQRIRESRIGSTRQIVRAIERAEARPDVLVSASAVGFYGARHPDEELDEETSGGDGFLAEVVRDWEKEAEAAEALGVRVVRARIGIVLGPGGGALMQMLPAFRAFVGGPVGDGKQVLSWVHEDDAVRLLCFALDDQRVRGAFNVVAPNPATMNQLARTLADALGRPAAFRVPAFAVRLALGEASMPVLTGQRVVPRVAERLGFAFRYPDLDGAVRQIVGASAALPTDPGAGSTPASAAKRRHKSAE